MAYDVLEVSRHIINYSNEKEYEISNLKLQKLLYFVQAYFLLDSAGKRSCFNEKIEAWDFGPVVPVAYHEFKRYGSGNIPSVKSYLNFEDKDDIWSIKRVSFNDDKINLNDKSLINAVVDEFSSFSATSLIELTHKQEPWMSVYRQHENNEITCESLMEYFNE